MGGSSEAVSVIVNVFNEAETIQNELQEIHAEIIERLPGSELIVAEDGSSDGTREILERLKVELKLVLSTSSTRKGYAKAFRDAVQLAKHDYIFFSDTGGKQDVTDFWKLYRHRQNYGIVSGARIGRRDPLYRQLMTKTYNFLLRNYFQTEIRDADSGFRLYQAQVLRKIAGEKWVNQHLISSELSLRAIYSGFKIKEVPIIYNGRKGVSRGLPLKKISKVIFSVLGNFARLKQDLTSVNIRSTPESNVSFAYAKGREVI